MPDAETPARRPTLRRLAALAPALVIVAILAFVAYRVLTGNAGAYPGGLRIQVDPDLRLYLDDVELDGPDVFLPWDRLLGQPGGVDADGEARLGAVAWLPSDAPAVYNTAQIADLVVERSSDPDSLLLSVKQSSGSYGATIGEDLFDLWTWEIWAQRSDGRIDPILVLAGNVIDGSGQSRQFFTCFRARSQSGRPAGCMIGGMISASGVTVTGVVLFGSRPRCVLDWTLVPLGPPPGYESVTDGASSFVPGESQDGPTPDALPSP